MSEMTLSSRDRIRNSSPGGLRPSTLPHVRARQEVPDMGTIRVAPCSLSREPRDQCRNGCRAALK